MAQAATAARTAREAVYVPISFFILDGPIVEPNLTFHGTAGFSGHARPSARTEGDFIEQYRVCPSKIKKVQTET
ncbi:MAG: hypothetical protein ACXWC1_32665, partial [Burkholderiales bacterium]